MFSGGETPEEAEANRFDAVQPVLAYHRDEARQQGHSSQAMGCPLLQKPGPEMDGLQSHRDAVLSLPPGAVLPAANAHTPVQAFQSKPGGRQFGVPFHPEFTPERLQANCIKRRERLWGTTGFDLDAALDQARPAPQTADLPRRL